MSSKKRKQKNQKQFFLDFTLIDFSESVCIFSSFFTLYIFFLFSKINVKFQISNMFLYQYFKPQTRVFRIIQSTVARL